MTGSVRGGTDPDAGGRGFAKVHRLVGYAECEGLVVAAVEDLDLGGGQQLKSFEKIQKAFVFFIDTQNGGRISGVQFEKENAALFAKPRDATAQGNAVRAGFARGKTLEQQG